MAEQHENGSKGSQFKPGQSGNPDGRPKGSKSNGPLLERLLLERRHVRGQKKALTVFEIVFYQASNKALLGDEAAIRNWSEITRLCGALEKKPATDAPDHFGILVIPGTARSAEE